MPKPKQKFVVSRRKDNAFKPGFRSYFLDRDLGLPAATGGAFMEGEGVFRFEQGDTWTQPPAIKHNFLECSADCEILEICSPGNFETIEAWFDPRTKNYPLARQTNSACASS